MLRSRVSIRHCVWLFAVCGWAASEADLAVVRLMRIQGDGVQHVRLLHRAPVNSELDIVVVLGTPAHWPAPGAGDGGPWVAWEGKSKLGLFLQRRDKPGLLYKIAIENGQKDGECLARVERATATDVVISCTPEKGGPGPNRKFVYDVRAKGLVSQVAYQPFAMRHVFVAGEKAVLVGTDGQRLVAIEYLPGREQAFRLRSGSEAGRWTRRVPFTTDTIIEGATRREQIYLTPKPFKPVRFGTDNRFTLSLDDEAGSTWPGGILVVLEQTGRAAKRITLPQSSFEEFMAARPTKVRGGYSREVAKMNERIGPWQLAEGTLWFARTFYDGEGMTGVGGFGYFDAAEGQYRFLSPNEIRGWSSTAMLVEHDALWLGLATHGEWGTSGGGVVRYDRQTRKVDRLALREIVGEIARVGGHLVMATEFGAALFDGNSLRRFFVDETADGRLRVAEALPIALPIDGGAGFSALHQNRSIMLHGTASNLPVLAAKDGQ